MPIDELATGFFRLIGRFLLDFFLEIVFEIVFKGPGYLILKTFSREEPDIEDWDVLIVSIFFWVAVAGMVYFGYSWFSTVE